MAHQNAPTRMDMDGPMLRTVLFEKDEGTSARSVRDIVEFAIPEGVDASSWTALSRNADTPRRSLLLALCRQIDQLVAGEIDEICIVRQG